jgi:hypothetical protein
VLTVRQQKTGTTLAIPVHSDLRAILDATPGEHLTFLVTSLGPYTAANFSKQFREWCDAAGLPKCSAHGLRKAACRRLAEAGCSANEIAAISGHGDLEGGGALHPCRRSGAHGAQRDGTQKRTSGQQKSVKTQRRLTIARAKPFETRGKNLKQ